ncbi:MAG TPA: sugar phosphate isomerase/epimerase [Mycobacteriales bacterium]|nr:sugar phosphate isomerase/epimerase [Mycobacteriales bacterium]
MSAPIAVQLYTFRREPDLPTVLRRVADMGYLGVETAGLHDMDPAEFRALAADLGLTVVSAHSHLPIGAQADEILDAHEAAGVDRIVVSLMPDRWRSRDEVLRAADDFNEGFAQAQARGVALGYHNHFWELGDVDWASCPFDVFLERVVPDAFFEVDVYWVASAGRSPAELLSRLGDRVRLMHVKDGPPWTPSAGPLPGLLPVGAGCIDIGAAVAAAPAVEWHIVELDECATDTFEAVSDSYAFLTRSGFSRGRT